MSGKANLLVVGNYNRKEYLEMFSKSKAHFNFFFLEFASRQEIQHHYYKTYGEAIFWGDYQNVYDLLKQIKPHKVVFLFIESYYHLLLNLACKGLGIKTYLLDHGVRDVNINLRFENNLIAQKRITSPSNVSRTITQLISRIKTRLFLKRSLKLLPDLYASFFQQFYFIRKANHYLETSKRLDSPLRLADAYISYSKKIYQVHQHYDHLTPEHKVHFIGIPYYDHLAGLLPEKPFKRQIIMIEQGLSNTGLFGWSREGLEKFVYNLSALCTHYNYQILVKLHPAQPESDAQLWSSAQNVKLIDNEELTLQLPYSQLIIGFYSTYLLPLMALPFTTVVTLENHPIGKIDVSKSFIEAGVAHPVYDVEELHGVLENIEALHQQQLPHKAKFTQEWMYKFDGKAGERLRDILLGDDL